MHNTPSTDVPTLIDIRGVAAMLCVSVPSVRRMVDSGRLPRPLRLTAQLHRWRRADVEKFLNDLEPDSVADSAASDAGD